MRMPKVGELYVHTNLDCKDFLWCDGMELAQTYDEDECTALVRVLRLEDDGNILVQDVSDVAEDLWVWLHELGDAPYETPADYCEGAYVKVNVNGVADSKYGFIVDVLEDKLEVQTGVDAGSDYYVYEQVELV